MATPTPADEFPVLRARGLYAGTTTGHGDCLFRALSDQLYSTGSHHLEIRARVVQHMRRHASRFKSFIIVNPGGGTRRNPRRKGVTYQTFDRPPTDAEVEVQFAENMARMAEPGTYGDYLEIQAFSAAYGVRVRVYTKDGVLEDILPTGIGTGGGRRMRSGSGSRSGGGGRRDGGNEEDLDDDDDEEQHNLLLLPTWPLAHLAYHDYEHYSTVHSLHTPHHTGLFASTFPSHSPSPSSSPVAPTDTDDTGNISSSSTQDSLHHSQGVNLNLNHNYSYSHSHSRIHDRDRSEDYTSASEQSSASASTSTSFGTRVGTGGVRLRLSQPKVHKPATATATAAGTAKTLIRTHKERRRIGSRAWRAARLGSGAGVGVGTGAGLSAGDGEGKASLTRGIKGMYL
ncbi:hypothetical protein MMC19_003423 [Ptychographa xylographoides]|nr:hypothetical protein [Ptychographa xylographoides]